jgi:pyrroloquinoline quinone biosynthesis protein D
VSVRVRLARRARLRRDPLGGAPLLLWPERGLALSTSAAEIVALLDGSGSAEEIADLLAARHGTDPGRVRADVDGLLAALDERGLLEREP